MHCRPFVLFFICYILAEGSLLAESSAWLYVSLLEDKKIVAYERDTKTGKLTRRSETKCRAEPGVLCVSPDRKTLFVAHRSTGQLASYRIDSETGALTLINVAEGGADPCYLTTDKNGHVLLCAYYVANQVTVHQILPHGELATAPLQVIPTAKNAHAIELNARNNMAFVPHTGGNQIFQFHFHAAGGSLRPSKPASIRMNPGEEPRHVAIHPNSRWVYANNEAGDSVCVFDVNQSAATLRRVQTLTTLPPGFDSSQNTTARCELSDDGKSLYVANRGSHTLAAFAVNASTGRLTPRGTFPTETTPRSFTIDPASRYLYAAGQDSGKIAVYRIQDNSRLKRVDTYAVGPVPWAVLAFDIPAAEPDKNAMETRIISDIEYAKVGSTPLLLDLHMPETVTRKPLIVWIHGGAWRAGSRKSMPLGWLVESGHAVASIDYRLSPVAKFPAQIHDCKAAIRFLRAKAEQFGYQAEKVVIAGSSAGGHLVALTGVTNNHVELEGDVGEHQNESSRVDGIIDYYGPTNFMTILKQSTPHGLGVRIPALQLLLGNQPEKLPDLARLASPVFHVDANDPPLLLLHGDQDPQVPINQSHELHAAYKDVGAPVQFEVVHGGAHGGPQFFDEYRRTIVEVFLREFE